MLRLTTLLLFSITLFAQSINLVDFAFIVQKKDNVSIIFASDVPKNLMIDFPENYDKSSYLPFFKSVLSVNKLSFSNDDGIITVSNSVSGVLPNSSSGALPNSSNIDSSVFLPRSSPPNMRTFDNNISMNKEEDYNFSFVSHKLNYLQFDNVKALLEFSKIPYSFAPVSKTITFKDNGKDSKLIKKLITEIESIDVLKDQVTLKITIFDTNQNKLKDVGFNPNLTFDFDILSQTGALLTGTHVADFKGSLKFLQSSGVTKIIQSTSYLICDSEKLEFNKVLSIPVLDENYIVTNQNATNQSTRHKYKDVGFVVHATPTIVGDVVYLDFSLSIGAIVTSGDLPITSENSINNKFSLKRGDVLLLAGISKNTIINSKQGLPFLESIPFLSSLFTEDSNSNVNETFNVSVEVF